MKKYKSLIIFLFCLILFTACSRANDDKKLDIDSTIHEPENKALPMEGVWTIVKIDSDDDNLKNLPTFSINDKLYISRKLVAINDFISTDPSFSSKLVNIKEYFQSKLVKPPEIKDIGENVKVLMVRDGDNFSMDFTMLDKDNALFLYESRTYYLKRTDKKVPEDLAKKYIEFANIQEKKEVKEKGKSLISFIGVYESVKNSQGFDDELYSTYMIYDDGNMDKPLVNKIEGLYIPSFETKSSIMTYRTYGLDPDTGLKRGIFSLYSADDPDGSPIASLKDRKSRQITYCGKGLISFAYKVPGQPMSAPGKYEIRSLDKLGKEALGVDKIAGQGEVDAFKEQIMIQKSFIDPEVKANENGEEDLSNIGVVRQKNRWSFMTAAFWTRGTNNYSTKINLNLNTDIQIFDSPTKQFDWSRLVNRFPMADTASLSPDGSRMIVKTEDEIHYMPFLGDGPANKAILSIQVHSNSKIISLDYFTDKLADQAKENFLKLNLSQPQVIFD